MADSHQVAAALIYAAVPQPLLQDAAATLLHPTELSLVTGHLRFFLSKYENAT